MDTATRFRFTSMAISVHARKARRDRPVAGEGGSFSRTRERGRSTVLSLAIEMCVEIIAHFIVIVMLVKTLEYTTREETRWFSVAHTFLPDERF